MEVKKLKSGPLGAIFLVLAVVCLLYLRYYERNYYTIFLAFPLVAYQYLAIPGFYFCMGAGVSLSAMNMVKWRPPQVFCRVIRYFVGLLALAYFALVALRSTGALELPMIRFWSVLAVAFALPGVFLGLAAPPEGE